MVSRRSTLSFGDMSDGHPGERALEQLNYSLIKSRAW